MIILRQGTNEASFTLNEKFGFYDPSPSTYTDLYYVVNIKDDMSEYEQSFILLSTSDLSVSPERYNKFRINITGSSMSDPWSASQSYPIVGLTGPNESNYDSQWTYEVYAMEGPAPISGTISLSPNGATALGPAFLEKGRMLYTDKYGKPWHTIH